MGKASRWIRNLLLGKKEDKANNKDGGGGGIVPSSAPSTTAIVPATPRRRWSFRRSNCAQKVVAVSHKSCRSFDSIMSSQLLSQALYDYAIQHQNYTMKTVVTPASNASRRVTSLVAATAATKIQAAFRSYLARRALYALRGLVKLQAVVRGHLVRKRTAAMVKCMSALVAIQVRARFQRIRMAEDASLTRKPGFATHERRLSAPQYDYNEKSDQIGSKTIRQASRRYSTDLSPLTREKSVRLHSKPADEVEKSTRHDGPNYMTKTESSRAKTRSQSEPRQRPTKQKRENRRTSSNESLDAVTQNRQKSHDGLLTTVYGPSKSVNDFEFDSASSCTNGSSYYTTLYEYNV